MERRLNIGRIIISTVAVLLVILFLLMLYNDSKLQNFLNTDYQQNSSYDYEQEQNIIQNIQKVEESLNNSFSDIVLYTDEYGNNGTLADTLHTIMNNDLFGTLNAQLQKYPRILGHYLDMTVSNFEVHNESFETILARIGIETIFTAQRLIMPASSGEQVNVHLKTITNSPIIFSTQQYTSLGQVTINGISGQLSRPILDDESDDNSGEGTYIFKRTENGEESKILSGARVLLESSEKYRDSLPIIFFGNNDYSDIQKYVKSVKSIISHQNINDKYIVICRTPANSETDDIMSENFDINYIRVDDKIDYNDLAEKIYYRMKTLGYLESITNSIEQAKQNILPEESS